MFGPTGLDHDVREDVLYGSLYISGLLASAAFMLSQNARAPISPNTVKSSHFKLQLGDLQPLFYLLESLCPTTTAKIPSQIAQSSAL